MQQPLEANHEPPPEISLVPKAMRVSQKNLHDWFLASYFIMLQTIFPLQMTVVYG